ncbi:hypothetical protein DM01DRAFT_1188078 [Hesseltinella vesiculosa]|uniref:Uncharacterized protein n=1 Tax=Hesseltinella vesiculosa TaxID=101127 RepID=A0A1X2GR65_9FUNG|nr:hypothetical protein DM01DRAFT_1188078 [Hesseltinella vesiculosa]
MASHSRHRSSSPESPPPSHQAAAPMLTPPTQCQKLEPPSIAPSQLPPRKRIHSLKKQFTKPNLEVPMVQPLHPLSPNPPWPLPPASSTGSSSGTTLPPIPVSTDALSDMQPDSHDSPIVDIESEGDTAETDEEDWQQRKLSDEASTASDTSASKQKQAIIIQGNQGPAVPVPLFDLPLTSTSDQTKPLKKPRKIKVCRD